MTVLSKTQFLNCVMEESELLTILTVGAELQGIGNIFFLPAFICQVEMRS